MTNAAFADLETQVEELPYSQLELLQWKIAAILSQKRQASDISGLKKFLGNVDLNVDLDSTRGRNDPR